MVVLNRFHNYPPIVSASKQHSIDLLLLKPPVLDPFFELYTDFSADLGNGRISHRRSGSRKHQTTENSTGIE